MAGEDISINSKAKAFKNIFMELKLKNIGPFSFKHLVIRSAKSIIIENSAGGKTSIARVLYAFLSGIVDRALLKAQDDKNRSRMDKGSAELIFNGRKYRMEITSDNDCVDKILDADYAEYLVLTETTPLYAIYVSPDRMNIDPLITRFLPEPPELKKLEGQMYALEREAIDYGKIAEEYEKAASKYQKDLAKVEEELKKIEEQLAKWKEYENIKVIIKKREKEGELKNVKEVLEKYEKERKELLRKIENTNYEELKLRRKEAADELSSLYYKRKLYKQAREAFNLIKEGLTKLENASDVAYELNVPLFGQLIDPESIKTFIDDCNASIDEVESRHAEISQRIKELEEELNRLDRTIREYVSAYERLQQLEVEIGRLERRKRDLENEIIYLSRKVQEILQREGGTEDELIKRYASLKDINKLMARRNELLKEKEKLETYVRSFKEAAEKARKEGAVAEEAKKKYEELKKKYNTLKKEWQRQRKIFKDTFIKEFKEAFKNISIPDFNPDEMKFYRPPHTYSQSERLYITIAYQYALVKALHRLKREIPLVVIDLIVPLDRKYLRKILQLYKESEFNVVVFKTRGDEMIGDYDINEYLRRIEEG